MSYDEDYNDPNQRCEHGTFIGSWWGPDYLCHWCEDGISATDARRIIEERHARELERRAERFDELMTNLHTAIGWRADIAHWAVHVAADSFR